MSKSSRDRQAPPREPGGKPPIERRQKTGERRDDNARRTLEMGLDRILRPGNWAARLAYATGLQTGRPVEIERHLIPVGRAPGAAPLRVAFASDFHAGATTSKKVLISACEALESLEADVLLLGGDFVTVRARYINDLAPLLARVRTPLGKFAVLGNHDLRANNAMLLSSLRGAGVRVLDNETVRLAAPHDDISIIGLDDPIRGEPHGELLDEAEGIRIVLMHAPDGLLEIEDRHFDLALAGHTHGGQIMLPGGFKPYLPCGKLSRKYASGLYRLGPDGERALVVSRGVGCSTIPIRIGARSQVHLFTIG